MRFHHDFSSRFRILKGGKISLVVSAMLLGSMLHTTNAAGLTATTKTGYISNSIGGSTNNNVAGGLLSSDGKFVLVGGGSEAYIARLDSTGKKDTSFDADGELIVTTLTEYKGVLPDGDGYLVYGTDSKVTRINADGSIDTTWGPNGNGSTLPGPGNAIIYSAAKDANGNIYLQYHGTQKLTKLNSNGVVDTTWGDNGNAATIIWNPTIIPQADGSVLFAGMYNAPNPADVNWGIQKFTSVGVLDTNFGTAGTTYVNINERQSKPEVVVDANGKILITGYSWTVEKGYLDYDFQVVRLNANGTPDNSFGEDGIISYSPYSEKNVNNQYVADPTTYEAFTAVALQDDGKIVLAGYDSKGSLVVSRMNPNGILDESFGSFGNAFAQLVDTSGVSPSKILIQDDGKIVVLTSAWYNNYAELSPAAVRFNTDGTLDTTFGKSETTTGFALSISDTQTWLRPDPNNYTGAGDPNYGVFDSVTDRSTSYNYGYVKFTPTVTGKYDLKIASTTLNDTMFFIYDNSSDNFAIDGTSGAVTGTFLIGDDDSANDFGFAASAGVLSAQEGSALRSGLNDIVLTAGTEYVFVVSSYNSDDSGSIEFSLSGPAAVTLNDGSFPVSIDLFTSDGGDNNISRSAESFGKDKINFVSGTNPIGAGDVNTFEKITISIPTAQLAGDTYIEYIVWKDWDDDVDLWSNSTGKTVIFSGVTFNITSEVVGENRVVTFSADGGSGSLEAFNALLSDIQYSYWDTPFPDTAREFSITITDTAGVTSTPATFIVQKGVDATAPQIDFEESYPADDSTNISISGNSGYFWITFDETVNPVDGKEIRIYKALDDSLVTTITIDTDEENVFMDDDDVAGISLGDLKLEYETEYYVQIDAGAFVDSLNNEFAAISDTTSWSFTTTAAPLGIWTASDNLIANEGEYSDLEYAPDGTAYVIHYYYDNAGLVGVKKLVDGAWENVGGASVSEVANYAYDLAIASDNTPYIITSNVSGVQVYKLNSENSAWEIVGTGLWTSSSDFYYSLSPDIEIHGTTLYAAYRFDDSGTRKTQIKSLDLSVQTPTWQNVGDAFDISGDNDTFDLAIDSAGTLYFATLYNYDLRFYKFDTGTSSWSLLNTATNAAVYQNNRPIDLKIFETTPYIVHQDGASSNDIKVSQFDTQSNQWNQLGSTIEYDYENNQALDIAFDSQGTPYVATTLNGHPQIMKWDEDSSAWIEMDNTKSASVHDSRVDLEFDANGKPHLIGINDDGEMFYFEFAEQNQNRLTNSVTLDVPYKGSTTTVTIQSPEGTSITNAANSGATALPKGLKLPLGSFGFDIGGLDNGQTVTMSMIVDANIGSYTYYKKNRLTNKWVNITKGVTFLTGEQAGKVKIEFDLTDGGAFDSDGLANGIIVDPGGIATNVLTPYVLEGTTLVGDASFVEDPTLFSGTITYSISGGVDADKFNINSTTGELTFKAAPSYANPTDTGDIAGNNTYVVEVSVVGSTSGSESKAITISVLKADGINTVTPIAPAISSENITILQGSTGGTTKITYVPANGNILKYMFSNTPLAQPSTNATLPLGAVPYTSGTDISGAEADKYLTVYELDGTGNIVGYFQKILSTSDINVETPSIVNPTRVSTLKDQLVDVNNTANFMYDISTHFQNALAYAALDKNGSAIPSWLDFSDGTFTIPNTDDDNETLGTYYIKVVASNGTDTDVSGYFTLRVKDLNASLTDSMTLSKDVTFTTTTTNEYAENNATIGTVNISAKVFRADNNESAPKTQHVVENVASATSYLPDSNIVVSSNGDVNTTATTVNNEGEEVDINVQGIANTNSEDKAIHILKIGETITKAISKIVGTITNITSDRNIETNATKDGISIQAIAYPDGSAEHTINTGNQVSKAISKIKGALTTLKNDGSVDTNVTYNNKPYLIVTDSSGNSIPSYDGEPLIDITEGYPVAPGGTVTIKEDGNIDINTTIPNGTKLKLKVRG